MLSRAVDPQVQARRALNKVYALLYRLADENEDQKTILPKNFDEVDKKVEQLSTPTFQDAQ